MWGDYFLSAIKIKSPQHLPTPHKEVFVSRTKFPVFLPKALLPFIASTQEIFSSYETAKHFKKRNNVLL